MQKDYKNGNLFSYNPLVAGLEKQMQSLKRSINSFKEVNKNLDIDISLSAKNIEKCILELWEHIKKLQKEIEEESIWDEWDKKVELIASITWISKYIAKVIYISFATFHRRSTQEYNLYYIGFENF